MWVNSVCFAPDLLDLLHRFLEREVRRVLLVLERVEHEHVEVFEQRVGRLGDSAHVGAVGERGRRGSRAPACRRASAGSASR